MNWLEVVVSKVGHGSLKSVFIVVALLGVLASKVRPLENCTKRFRMLPKA